MKKTGIRLVFAVFLMMVIAGVLSCNIFAEDKAEDMQILECEGTAEITDLSGTVRPVQTGIVLDSGETVRTGEDSRVSIGLDSAKTVIMDENSCVEVVRESGDLELTLREGQLLFDVREKLEEGETFHIKASEMEVGIRGTIGVVSVMPVNAVTTQNTAVTSQTKEITSVMIFEGGTEVTLNDGTDSNIELYVPAAQMLVVPDNIKEAGVRPSCVTIKKENINAFTIGEIKKNNNLRDRAEKYVGEILIPLIEESTEGDAPTSDDDQKNDPQLQDAVNNGYPADTEWEYRKRVDLIAQSASKLYDGTPLTRPGDILVEGLPEGLSIDVSADGSRTDAGVSSNPISKYTIYNKLGEDVTSHFKNVVITEGSLVVDPAPLVVWTGSASKVYDGTPLTNPNAGIRSYPGHEENQPLWRNMSYIVGNSVESTQAQVLYGICGTIWVHGTNPLTTDTIEKELKAGEKLTVYLSDEGGEESIRYEISSVGVNELPDEVIRIYANNPEMMKQACSDAGWSRELMEKRIQDLLNSEDGIYASKETVEHDGLTVNAEDTDSLMRDCTNVRINIDTSITDYNDRALSRQESYYTPVQIDESIKITAVGSRTYVGYNKNYYTIDWGNANRDNYILYEELGTLRVYTKEKEDPADPDNPDDPDIPDDPTYDDEIVITASSASKTYNGKPLTSASVTVSGLPSGFRLEAAASGSQTDAGTGTNRILSFKIYDSNGKDVTSLCTNVNLETGNLTVRPAALTITTNSDEKIYDGTSLTAAGVKLDGLAQTDKKKVTAVATGSITDAGSVKNSYSIDWGNANKDNYTVKEELGTLNVTPAPLTITTDNGEKEYDGTPLTASGVELNGLAGADSEEVTVTATGSITDVGSADNSYSIDWGNANKDNYTVSDELGTLYVTPASLTIKTDSGEKEYDGTPLTASGVELDGLAGADSEEVTVTATGSITDAGSADNSYSIDWGNANKDNYTVSDQLGTLTVSARPLAITTGSDEKEYDGTPLTNDQVSIEGLIPSDQNNVSVKATGSQTEVGSSKNTYTISWGTANENNYILSEELGTLEVYARENVTYADPVTLTASSASKTYDGKPLTSPGLIVSGLPSDFRFEAATSGSQTDAGTGTNRILSYKIYDSNGKDVTSLFTNVNLETGNLTVNPATLKITTNSDEKIYDGTPLTAAGVELDGLAQADSEEVTVTATGSITDSGSAENSYSIDWGNANKDNYTVTEDLGTLTVAPVKIEFNLHFDYYENTIYSGYSYISETIDGFYEDSTKVENEGIDYIRDESDVITSLTATYKLKGGDKLELTADAPTDAGEYTVTPSETFVTGKAQNYDISYINNEITISPAPLTITTGSDSGTYYISTPLTNSDVTMEGLAEPDKDKVKVEATGSLEDAGSTPNTYKIDWGDANPDNYEITENLGTLEVSPIKLGIRLGYDSSSKEYTGYPIEPDWQDMLTGVYEGEAAELERVSLVYNYEGDLPVSAIGVFNLLGGGQLTVTLAFPTDAGNHTLVPTLEFSGDANKENYDIVCSEDTKTITPRSATLWTSTDEKVYDGKPLTSPEAGIDGITEADEEKVKVTGTGSITEVGEIQNTYTIDWGGVNPGNYVLEDNLGTLTITEVMEELSQEEESVQEGSNNTSLKKPGNTPPEQTQESSPDQSGETSSDKSGKESSEKSGEKSSAEPCQGAPGKSEGAGSAASEEKKDEGNSGKSEGAESAASEEKKDEGNSGKSEGAESAASEEKKDEGNSGKSEGAESAASEEKKDEVKSEKSEGAEPAASEEKKDEVKSEKSEGAEPAASEEKKDEVKSEKSEGTKSAASEEKKDEVKSGKSEGTKSAASEEKKDEVKSGKSEETKSAVSEEE